MMGLDTPCITSQEIGEFTSLDVEDDANEELTELRFDTPFPDVPEQTEEGRLSRALQSWKRNYVITPIEPLVKPPREPTFSAKLRKKSALERAPSTESLITQISLLSCSSGGERPVTVPSTRTRRCRRKRLAAKLPKQTEFKSKWVELVQQRRGVFDKMMKQHTMLAAAYGIGCQEESEAFQAMDKDEQRMIYRSGLSKGIHYVNGLKKSDSITDIQKVSNPTRRRILSASATKGRGRPLNLTELRKQAITQKLSYIDKKSKLSKMRSGSTSQSMSSLSILSGYSSNFSDTPSVRSVSSASEVDEPVQMWKGDSQILEIDLNRELSSKVKQRIGITSRALRRVTGLGDDNRGTYNIGVHKEYPRFTDDDFSLIPKISQRIRISPALSAVINEDIKIRMGLPRYHEIKTKDLEMWDRGQSLNRSHRNLKVFNWLHSLREDEFESQVENPIDDDHDESIYIHVESVDEPDIIPLYSKSSVKSNVSKF